jgi:hypothetical protein
VFVEALVVGERFVRETLVGGAVHAAPFAQPVGIVLVALLR